MPAKLNLAGLRFGRLVAIAETEKGHRPKAPKKWLCKCDCGSEMITETGALRSGHTKSCGCLQKDIAADGRRSHGMHKSSEYKAWTAMISRCTRKSNASYLNYGGRGIKVCERWLVFEGFFADMGIRQPGMTIDRIDPNGNYDPANCRWATKEEQDNNKRNSLYITFEGRTMTCSQWGRELNQDPSALRQRWKKFGTLIPIKRTKESYHAKKHRTN